jgi:hypothetical protein
MKIDPAIDKTLGCLKGKAIGGTLGTPVEGKMEVLSLTYYDPVPQGILPNDDLDLQLLALETVENHGGEVRADLLARMWRERVNFPFDEYGVGIGNLANRLMPPQTGNFDNPFQHCMGSPIRSELWGLLAPGRPQLAAYFALQDAVVDHGLEGIAGDMLFAALEAASFGESDFRKLVAIGLKYTPKYSRTYQAVEFTLKNFPKYPDFRDLRTAVLEKFGHPNFTDAPQNIAFTLFGLLYHPDDFEKALLLTTNCGYDTDCTAATIGAIWGAAKGDHFPERWLKPIGNILTASHPIVDMGLDADLEGLAKRIILLSKTVMKRYARVKDSALAAEIATTLKRPGRQVLRAGAELLEIDYGKSPVISKALSVSVKGSVKAVHARYPLSAKKVGAKIQLKLDPKAEFIPKSFDVVLETPKGAFARFAVLSMGELWMSEPSNPAEFEALAKAPFDRFPIPLKPFQMMDRSVDLKKTGNGDWLHLGGWIHLGSFNKYRIFPSAEAPVVSFIDGAKLIDLETAYPNIPAPHRFGDKRLADVELRPGWHRWDTFFKRSQTIRSGEATLVLANAYTKQLVPYRFYRKPAGVYNHGVK